MVQEKIIIKGIPIPLKRHRHTKLGHSYNSQRKEMDQVSFIVKSQWGFEPLSVPTRLFITFFMKIPSSLKKGLEGTYHSKRPDTSNILKFYEDSLNGVLWTDDSILVEIHASKIYSSNPRTEIIIEPAE